MLPSLAASLGKLLHMPLFGHKMWFSAAPATALVTGGWCWCMLSHLNHWVHALLKVSISCSTLPYMVMRRGSKNSFLSGGAGRRVDLLAGPPIAPILGVPLLPTTWSHDQLQFVLISIPFLAQLLLEPMFVFFTSLFILNYSLSWINFTSVLASRMLPLGAVGCRCCCQGAASSWRQRQVFEILGVWLADLPATDSTVSVGF